MPRQCLTRRIDDLDVVNAELAAWQTATNGKSTGSSPRAMPASNFGTYTQTLRRDVLLVQPRWLQCRQRLLDRRADHLRELVNRRRGVRRHLGYESWPQLFNDREYLASEPLQ